MQGKAKGSLRHGIGGLGWRTVGQFPSSNSSLSLLAAGHMGRQEAENETDGREGERE